MALPKLYHFSAEEQQLAKYGQSISHPARIRTLDLLLAGGPQLFTDLSDLIPLSPNTVSNHLRLLERAGMIQYAEVFYGETGYAVNPIACQQACQLWRDMADKGERFLAKLNAG